MIKNLTAFLLLILVFACSKPSSKIQILNFQKVEETTFETIKEQALEKNKVIFVDVYAEWCGPCKYMDKTAFQNSALVKSFHADFINYKVDAENFDGINIAMEYKVNSYPTYLFLNAKGEELKRLEGIYTPEALLKHSKELY